MCRVLVLVCCCLISGLTNAQQPSVGQALKDFRQSVSKGRFIVQGFSDDPTTTFKWTADGLLIDPPKLHTFGIYSFPSVILHKDAIELIGMRSIVLKDRNDKLKFFGEAPITIRIALNRADPAQVLPQLKASLFFPSLQAAFDAIPVDYRKLVPASLGRTKGGSEAPSNCSAPGQIYKFPVVIFMPEADVPPEALSPDVNKDLTIAFTVDERGHLIDEWLTKPAGPGLDEETTSAWAQYKFKPATCDGVAIKATFGVDVNYSIRNPLQ